MNTQSTPKEERIDPRVIIAIVTGFGMLLGIYLLYPFFLTSQIKTEMGPISATTLAALIDSSILQAKENETYDPKNPWDSIQKFILVNGRNPSKIEEIGRRLPKPWEIKLGTPTQKTIVTLPNNKKFDADGPVTEDPGPIDSQ